VPALHPSAWARSDETSTVGYVERKFSIEYMITCRFRALLRP